MLFRFCGCRNLPRTADAEQQHCSRARDLGGSGGSGGGGGTVQWWLSVVMFSGNVQ